MQRIALLFIFHISLVFLRAQPLSLNRKYVPRETIIYYRLGNSIIQLKTLQYGNAKDLVMINLHDDETTSVIVAKKFLAASGGLLIKIENKNQRNIRFDLLNNSYEVDPNRIFSREGISKSLEESGNTSSIAINEVEKFGMRILQLIPGNPSCVIGLHNNSKEEFSITSYLPGNEKAANTRELYTNPAEDADDLFLTTDSLLYRQLSAAKYNIVWQDNRNAEKDGSLSIYCAEKYIRYLNCETQHGKVKKYDKMMTSALAYIERVSSDAVLYPCRWMIPGKINSRLAQDIYFGERKVGIIKSVNSDSVGNFCAKLEIKKSFPIYTNNDFFLLHYPDGNSKIEARIDPTGAKKLLSPGKDIIEIIVR